MFGLEPSFKVKGAAVKKPRLLAEQFDDLGDGVFRGQRDPTDVLAFGVQHGQARDRRLPVFPLELVGVWPPHDDRDGVLRSLDDLLVVDDV